jgi:excisionase family DNA binding protein
MENPFQTILETLARLENKVDKLDKKTTIPDPKRYTVYEFATATKSTEQTVRTWIKEGKIKAERIGRRLYISEAQFLEGLQEVKSLKYKR